MRELARIVFACWGCASLVLAVLSFEGARLVISNGYFWLIQGAVIFAILPPVRRPSEALRILWWLLLGLCVGVGSYCACEVYLQIRANPSGGMIVQLLPFWPLGVFSVFCAALSLDRLAGVRTPSVPTSEWMTVLLFFISALALRFAGPTTVAADEMAHIMQMSEKTYLMGTLCPGVLIGLHKLLNLIAGQFVDMITVQKGVSYVAGALSVAFWYVAIRVLSNRQIAVCSTILLTFFGWHWLNSRFIYAYPADLAAVSLGIMALLLAMRVKSLVFGCLAGVAVALTLILEKAGGLLGPFMAYLALEFLWRAPREERRRMVCILAVALVTFLVAYEPFAIRLVYGLNSSLRYEQAAQVREQVLPKLGLTPFTALLAVYVDAFRQFQVTTYDWARHVFRPEKPILDPVFSILFSVGLVHTVISLRRSMAARVCLVGLLIFILPMALSFPVDDEHHGLARRMLPTSFFLAWLGGIGAWVVSRALLNKERAIGLSYAVCIISALTNVYYYLTVYMYPVPMEWLSPGGRGLQNMAMMEVVRSVATSKMRVIVFEQYAAQASGLPASDQLRKVDSAQGIREALLERKGEMQMVVVPGDTQALARDVDSVIRALSDLISLHAWIPAAPHPDGTPMMWYAFVRPH